MKKKGSGQLAHQKSKSDETEGSSLNTAIAERLILELVSGKVGGATFPLSEVQETLKIDPAIVYLAAICFAEQTPLIDTVNAINSPSVTPRLKSSFQALQGTYHGVLSGQENSDNSSTTSIAFELSPRLCPSLNQLDVVQKDMRRVQETMQQEAQAAAEALMLEYQEEDLARKKTGSSSKKKSKSVAPIRPALRSEGEDGMVAKKAESLEELRRRRFTSTHQAEARGEEPRDENWVEVTKCKRKVAPLGTLCRTTPLIVDQNQKTVSREETTDPRIAKLASTAEMTSSVSESENDNAFYEENTKKIGEEIVVNDATEEESALEDESISGQVPARKTVPATCDDQMQRIRDLEAALEETKRRHETNFRKERQRFEDLIQSLQLRLYISETRLKTYEEALQSHMEAVAANVSGGGAPLSPKALKFGGEKIGPSPRSLIAKAMQQNITDTEEYNKRTLEDVSEPVMTSTDVQCTKTARRRKGVATSNLVLCLLSVLVLILPTVSSRRLIQRLLQKKKTPNQWVEKTSSNADSFAPNGFESEKESEGRKFLMLGQFQARDPYAPAVPVPRQRHKDNTHPLRTDHWEFVVRWTIKCLRKDHGKQFHLGMELHPDGYALASVSSPDPSSPDPGATLQEPIGVGRWTKQPWGVTVAIRPLISRTEAGSRFQSISKECEWVFFSPAFHLNPFRGYPKLSQGIVIRQRPDGWILDDDYFDSSQPRRSISDLIDQQWFRPVIGKFSAFGSYS